MNVIFLIEPQMKYAEDIWAFRKEILEFDQGNDDQFAGCKSLDVCRSAEEWIKICELRKSEDTCREAGVAVPSHTYLAVRRSDNKVIGVIDLRHHINHPILSTWGGHSGYTVRPSERGHGYAQEMLRLNILNAKKMGIQKLLVPCDANNIASEKTIIANGGVFENIIDVNGSKTKRYWITVEERNNDRRRTMADYRYITLREKPEQMLPAAQWFHSKWRVPTEAYVECMEAYLNKETEYGWYLCYDGDQLIGGLGVIENDFHDRKDLTPNVCAVYTEEAYRGQGIAGRLLNMAVEDLRVRGVSPVYLVTDHTGFYERYGWEFLCMVQGDGEPDLTRMYIHR